MSPAAHIAMFNYKAHKQTPLSISAWCHCFESSVMCARVMGVFSHLIYQELDIYSRAQCDHITFGLYVLRIFKLISHICICHCS